MNREYRTQHYIFHYQSGTRAEADIEAIAREQEECFSRICGALQVEFPDKIRYRLCGSPAEAFGKTAEELDADFRREIAAEPLDDALMRKMEALRGGAPDNFR